MIGVKKTVGTTLIAGYGNALTDSGGYSAAGIPKKNIWLIGKNAGKGGTQPMTTYPAHLPSLTKLPTVVQP